ncbi:E3 ubiquitin-protein ligase RNF169 isoform X1 [Syngnathus scovelli]|uniref:E3 ubiquitin-protein ligase RNF169 isoform X1 n=1 Tax=Syngnathus scovelli TaxID=161590 RepID=UPI00210F946E|nr:E3 ubiquitin-protein ligase RNF169 isoform X1 [Syngnathus scovelli]
MAAAVTGRRSGKAAAAAAEAAHTAADPVAARASPVLGTASGIHRSSEPGRRSCSARWRRSTEAKRKGGGGGAAGRVAAAADARARPSDVFVCPSAVHKSTEGSSSGPNLTRKVSPSQSPVRPVAVLSLFFFFPCCVAYVANGCVSVNVFFLMELSMCEEREDVRRRGLRKDESGSPQRGQDSGVLSDSENEEPVSRRIRRFSAFVRRSRTMSGVASGVQRSRSCTEAGDNARGKTKGDADAVWLARPQVPSESAQDLASCRECQAGAAHSSTAGILLSSENSRSASAPVGGPDRRPARRGGVAPPPATAAPPERSVSPESNDSISEELNHFKPIVCSPCTPPKRLADGRLLEPAVVKSTPRNLTWRLHKPTSYEASPAVLQRWRQIELDRQSFKVNSKGTLTSPVTDTPEAGGASNNKRKLLFDPPGPDGRSLKIRVPAVHYCGDFASRGGDAELESGAGVGALFGRRHSFSPYARGSSFQSCKLAAKGSLSPRKETAASKRSRKTKHQDAAAPRVCQERKDRAFALKLQRQFERERAPPGDKYFLRSWMANHSRRRLGLRRSRRINQQR